MKKKIVWASVSLLVIVALFAYFVKNHVLTFYYLNPYTDTASMPYIAPTIKKLNKFLDEARSFSAVEGHKYNIVFSNAYGSGFIKDNPIPNDLDFDVLIDLGTFDYNESKTSYDVADEIVKEMDSFQYSLVSVIGFDESKTTLTYRSSAGQNRLGNDKHVKFVEEIAGSLDDAISGKKYVDHVTKKDSDSGETIYYLPYVMQPGKLIVKDYDLLMLYNNQISYNAQMPKYIRELSIGLAYTAKIKHGDKISTIELIPELFSTGPLSVSNRLYAPNVFFKNTAPRYLKSMPELANDEEFYKSLMFCFLDHLLVVYPKDGFEYNPLKAMKRILQIVDMIEPALPQEDVVEIRSAIKEEWKNRDIVLLNEFNNLVNNLNKIYIRPVLFGNAIKNGDMDVLIKTMNRTLKELEERGNVSQEHIKVFKDYRSNKIKEMLYRDDYLKMQNWERTSYDKEYRFKVAPIIAKAVLSQLKHKDLIIAHVDKIRAVCDNAGYRYIKLYIADGKTIELEKDEFSTSIKDFKDFALKNDLAYDMEYKVLPLNSIPKSHLKYDAWVRYNTTKEQDAYFEEFKNAIIKSRPQFKLRRKHFIVF